MHERVEAGGGNNGSPANSGMLKSYKASQWQMWEQLGSGLKSRLVCEHMGKTWEKGEEWIQGHGIIWRSLWKHRSCCKALSWFVTTSCCTFRSSSLVMYCQDPMVGHTVQQQVHLQHLLPDPGQSAVREWRSVECNEVNEDGGGSSRGLTAPAN